MEGVGPSAEVRGVQYDSRRVGPGDVFVAMRGGTVDGNRFVEQAVAAGAAAVVTDSRVRYEAGGAAGIGWYWAEHGRRALAGIAANLLGHPEKALAVSAVTGTNGKTTTAFLLEQMLRSVGRQCVLVGTIETHVGEEVRASEHTTPEASDLLQVFADGGGGGGDRGGDGDVEPCAGPGAGVGGAGGCGDVYQPDAGSPGLSQDDGALFCCEGSAVCGGGGRRLHG